MITLVASTTRLRLGTRGSLLAKSQSALVAAQLQSKHPGLAIETIVIKTTGDRIIDKPLYEAGGKGLFIKELEQALLENQIDLAVHSCKDVPTTMPVVDQSQLIIAAIGARLDARDVLISAKADSIAALPQSARVATGSLRRRCQLLELRPDLKIEPIRGNIDTRIRKLRDGQFDAIILAMAGLERAELWDPQIMHAIPSEQILPAPGQGALAIQCRKSDQATLGLISSLNDPIASDCVKAERAIVAALEGDCHSPIAALAEIIGSHVRVRAVVGRRGGEPPNIRASATAPIADFSQAVNSVVLQLQQQEAWKLLHEDADT